MDCTDYIIDEPQPFHKKFFTKKFNHAGLRYELGVALYSPNIVWASGPHLPGLKNDITIYREAGLKLALTSNREMAFADSGYRGERDTIQEKGRGTKDEREVATRARARHETVNRRLKEWGCLSVPFRHNNGHDVTNHGIVFDAVLVLTQLSISINNSVFDL